MFRDDNELKLLEELQDHLQDLYQEKGVIDEHMLKVSQLIDDLIMQYLRSKDSKSQSL